MKIPDRPTPQVDGPGMTHDELVDAIKGVSSARVTGSVGFFYPASPERQVGRFLKWRRRNRICQWLGYSVLLELACWITGEDYLQ